ncbi:GNAT family N-acetyltransferase [Goodfellowiella coeruleoviolacea]|uniref:Acetyltransferase (GNAT) domain-containing protein n=1 Tax=Goodfellowiella coeruleoviolacea TaxID=334858 RepID=A0AAE3KIY9_9PSEU|nr:GNAT family N-acetyltransferase [Goodfellowiella coeruleoviolacea]MCP2167884.1 Acetyltransferase (GNAT) domain-containing protein [Goodfellowiella coeruleoviolacea]
MRAEVHADLSRFAALAGPLFAEDPVLHTVATTLLHDRMIQAGWDDGEALVLVTLHEGDHLCGAVLRVPRMPVVVSGLPADAVDLAVSVLSEVDPGLPGVTGPDDRAEAFARRWVDRTGATVARRMDQRLYRLGELRRPRVAGVARFATQGDLMLLATWCMGFARDAHGYALAASSAFDLITWSLTRGGVLLWELAGQPVAMAVVRPVHAVRMARVSIVYTPRELRGHGYGSAATAAASQWALGLGMTHVVLFTDLANPVSNAIYQRLGYLPVRDFLDVRFGERPDQRRAVEEIDGTGDSG